MYTSDPSLDPHTARTHKEGQGVPDGFRPCPGLVASHRWHSLALPALIIERSTCPAQPASNETEMRDAYGQLWSQHAMHECNDCVTLQCDPASISVVISMS